MPAEAGIPTESPQVARQRMVFANLSVWISAVAGMTTLSCSEARV